MTKYYNKEIPTEIHFIYGSRQSGKTYYEFKKLKEEYNILKENNVELFKSYERLVNRTGKTLKYIEELYKMTKEQDSDNVNLIDRLEIILKILKGEKNDKN